MLISDGFDFPRMPQDSFYATHGAAILAVMPALRRHIPVVWAENVLCGAPTECGTLLLRQEGAVLGTRLLETRANDTHYSAYIELSADGRAALFYDTMVVYDLRMSVPVATLSGIYHNVVLCSPRRAAALTGNGLVHILELKDGVATIIAARDMDCRHFVAGATQVICQPEETLIMLSDTGEEQWRVSWPDDAYPLQSSAPMAFCGTQLLVAAGTTVFMFDAATGGRLGQIDADGYVYGLSANNAGLVALRIIHQVAHGACIRVIRLATGEVLAEVAGARNSYGLRLNRCGDAFGYTNTLRQYCTVTFHGTARGAG